MLSLMSDASLLTLLWATVFTDSANMTMQGPATSITWDAGQSSEITVTAGKLQFAFFKKK